MRFLHTNITLLAAALLASCSSNMSGSKRAEVSTLIVSVDVSSSGKTEFIELDSIKADIDLLRKLSWQAKTYGSPFSPYDYIHLVLDKACDLRLELYDVLNNLRLVWQDEDLPEAMYEFDFSGLKLDPMGFYFARILVNGAQAEMKMLLLYRP